MRKPRVMFWLMSFVLAILAAPTFAQEAFKVQMIPLEGQTAYDLAAAPDGKIAAVYTGQTALIYLNVPIVEYQVDASFLPIRLVDLTTGAEIATLTGHTDYASDVVFSPDGAQVVSYHRNGDIIVWDVATAQPVNQLTGLIGSASIDMLPDGKQLVVYMLGSQIGQFLVWDLTLGHITAIWHTSYTSFGELLVSRIPASLDYQYVAFDVSPDGKWLVTATGNGEVLLWDTTTLEQTTLQPKAEKEATFNVRMFAFSSDSSTLVYYDTLAEQTHLWDVATQTEKMVLAGGGIYLAVSPDGTKLAWATRDELWYVDLAEAAEAVKVLDFTDGGQAANPTLAFTPDGSQIIVGGFGNHESAGSAIYVVTIN